MKQSIAAIMNRIVLFFVLLVICINCYSEDGYRLWLRYDKIEDKAALDNYKKLIGQVNFNGSSPTLDAAKKELFAGLKGLLGEDFTTSKATNGNSISIFVKPNHPIADKGADYSKLGDEGFTIYTQKGGQPGIATIITANSDKGVLYGVFHFLRLLQTRQSIQNLRIESFPHIQNRILDHWDNLNRTVERGYAGASIWNWHTLPDYIDQRYIDYARANASIGINGVVLNNVNANALILTNDYLLKVKALADVFRPYGIRVFLTARFSAPIELGKLSTADPLDAGVQNWWKQKVNEIYQLIPDFGGYLVKANSEGQPGPQNYDRNHADGANMLADALAPHKGIVMWRAFVYDTRAQKSHEDFDSAKVDPTAGNIASADRFKQAYDQFKPLDGNFRKNVLLQVKNGPIDFQPREPFSPLFGAMPQTPLMMEFQLTQEYLGQGTHLVYEAPLFKEVLESDTYSNGKGSTVAKIIDGSASNYKITGIAAVANIGTERNWTSHPFGQANWYAFGRLAWNHSLISSQIAEEWIRQSFSNNRQVVSTISEIMLGSREALVNYMTPLGLHHIMATGHHYGPGPWVDDLGRADWNPVYYHRADAYGIGFDRTAKGSNALSQYATQVQQQWNDSNQCDEKLLLWFHHVSWSHTMRSGKTLWNELCSKYQSGVDSVRHMQQQWNKMKGMIDDERFRQVSMLLTIQEKEANWWKDACILYFQTFSKMPIPPNIENPKNNLEYYKKLNFPFAPGNSNNI